MNFSSQPQDIQDKTVEQLQDTVPFRCSDEERSMLTKPVLEEEIREVIFHMPSNKAQGPMVIQQNSSKRLGAS